MVYHRSFLQSLECIKSFDTSEKYHVEFYVNTVFSLRREDLIRRSCLSVGPAAINFLIFQKRGFEIMISDLSNTTKLTLLESLLREVTAIVRLPNPKLSTAVWLPNTELNSVVRQPDQKFSAVVQLPNPKFSTVVGLPNPKMNILVQLPNTKLGTAVRQPNPK